MKDERDEAPEERDDEAARDAVLARRARFVAAALASAGIATASCGGETTGEDGAAHPCLEPTMTGGQGGAVAGAGGTGAPLVCLSPPQGGSGAAPNVCLGALPGGTGGETAEQPIDAGADARDDAGDPGPQVCLTR